MRKTLLRRNILFCIARERKTGARRRIAKPEQEQRHVERTIPENIRRLRVVERGNIMQKFRRFGNVADEV